VISVGYALRRRRQSRRGHAGNVGAWLLATTFIAGFLARAQMCTVSLLAAYYDTGARHGRGWRWAAAVSAGSSARSSAAGLIAASSA